jgi:hypothetical protein
LVWTYRYEPFTVAETATQDITSSSGSGGNGSSGNAGSSGRSAFFRLAVSSIRCHIV